MDDGAGEDVLQEPPPLHENDESVVMVAKSLKKAFSDMRETAGGQGWSAGDLSFGLWAVSRKRRAEVELEIAENQELATVPDVKDLLPDLLYYGNLIRGSYHSKTDEESRKRSGVSDEDFIHGKKDKRRLLRRCYAGGESNQKEPRAVGWKSRNFLTHA